MPYVPINVEAYTTAYSGAIAGMAVGSWIVDDDPDNYASVCAIAGAFSEAFDIVWNDIDALNELQLKAITSVVQNEFSTRQPGPLADTDYLDPDTWTIPAAACAALVNAASAYFTSEGIVPPSPPSFAAIPLSNRLYVDLDYEGTTKIGTHEQPFTDLQDALDAVDGDTTIILSPGQDHDDPVTVPATFKIEICTLGDSQAATINGITWNCGANGELILTNVFIANSIQGTAVAAGKLRLNNTTVDNLIGINGSAVDCYFSGLYPPGFNGDNASARVGNVEGGNTSFISGDMFADNYMFTNDTFELRNAMIENCLFTGTSIFSAAGTNILASDSTLSTITFSTPGEVTTDLATYNSSNGVVGGDWLFSGGLDIAEVDAAAFGSGLTTLLNQLSDNYGWIIYNQTSGGQNPTFEYGTKDLTAQTNNIAVSQGIIANDASPNCPRGIYQVDINIRVYTIGTAGSLVCQITYQNRRGAVVTASTTGFDITGTGLVSQSFILDIEENPSDFFFTTSGVVTPGTLAYDITVTARRIATIGAG